MSNAKINNEIDLTYPECFKEMNEAELARYFSTAENRWGVYDADRHIVLSVSWNKAGFFGFMTDAESVLIGAESRLRRNLLNYQRIAEFRPKIGGKKAYGIRFEYRVNDSVSVHTGDLLVFKYKKKFYSIYYITRKSNAAAARADLEEILKSIKLG